MEDDYDLALSLQRQFELEEELENPTQNLVYSKPKQTDASKSLTDTSWELIDPTPNVHVLFMAFNKKYFWNKLIAVAVSWSKRMTTCAGICSYQDRAGFCHITLSEPLLKLRPRKDLVETLLHEMIHAYLFVTKNNKDHDGHGPEFHSHMYRINAEAGTTITVYHDFHDEVRLYQQHWWRCNGPCQKQKPFFGMVRRAMNRAPGPNDRWWSAHQQNCGGTFIKVKEPEKSTKKKLQKDIKNDVKNDIRNFYPTLNQNGTDHNNVHGFKDLKPGIKNAIKNSSSTIVVTKKSNADADEKPNQSKQKQSSITAFVGTGHILDAVSSCNADDYSAVRNHWLKKFGSSDNTAKRCASDTLNVIEDQKRSKLEASNSNVNCPICEIELSPDEINAHLDLCLTEEKNERNDNEIEKMRCLVCNKLINRGSLIEHLDECVADSVFTNANVGSVDNESGNSCTIVDDDNSNEEKTYNCPVCFKEFSINLMSAHLDKCLVEKEDSNGSSSLQSIFDEPF